MKLQHIEINDLKLSPLNVRKHGTTDGADLIPSIRSLGIIQPLLVRKNCEGYEVVAGQRRLAACQALAQEAKDAGKAFDPIPCAILEDDEDALAIKASLAENIARLPMDAIDQFEAFAALIKQGQSAGDIARHFGVTERLVRQRLAIANLYGPIRNAFRREEFGAETLQILTMATTRQQKEWYRLLKSDEDYAPQGYQLKNWLFGGAQIPVSNALFDPEDYGGVIVGDLFGDERYFADPQTFWEHQNKAVAALAEQYTESGWAEVVILDIGEHFPNWEYVDTAKEDGGKVYIHISHDGEVAPYEGQLSRKEAQRRIKAETGESEDKPVRPELTKAMQNYLDLHRHAAVRAELLSHTGIALRLAVAQMIAGSPRWDVTADPQKAASDKIAASLEGNKAQPVFAKQRAAIIEKLGIETDKPLVCHTPSYGRGLCVHEIFARLCDLDDQSVLEILTFAVAETLDCGSAMVEGLGVLLGVDMENHWQPDEAFFDLMRDKEAVNAMLKEIGGKSVADGNVTATAKTQKQIIRDFVAGENGRTRKSGWQPRYMACPMKAYTKRGGIDAVSAYKAVKKHYKPA